MTAKAKRCTTSKLPSHPSDTIEARLEQAGSFPTASLEKSGTKSAQVIALLEREEGATLVDLCTATGWQAHSCRAFFTGLRKKGRVLERTHRTDGASAYKLLTAEDVSR